MGCFKLDISDKHFTTLKVAHNSLKDSENNYAGDYRFGFGGQEADDEITGTRSHYTAPGWEYDSRILRRWNIDPRAAQYPGQSPYSCFNGNPILYNDPTGEGGEVTFDMAKRTIKITATIYLYSSDDVISQQLSSSLNTSNITRSYTVPLTEYNTKQGTMVSSFDKVPYTIEVNLTVQTITPAKAREMQGKNKKYGADKNYYEIVPRAQLKNNLGTGEGMTVYSPNYSSSNTSLPGSNIGYLSIEALTERTGVSEENLILHEWWHSVVGANYENSTHPASNLGMVGGTHQTTMTETDMNALSKAAQTNIPNKETHKSGSDPKVVGVNEKRLVNSNDVVRQGDDVE